MTQLGRPKTYDGIVMSQLSARVPEEWKQIVIGIGKGNFSKGLGILIREHKDLKQTLALALKKKENKRNERADVEAEKKFLSQLCNEPSIDEAECKPSKERKCSICQSAIATRDKVCDDCYLEN
jgi:hypothetical protein